MRDNNNRALAELKELKEFAKEQKTHWEQSIKENKELNLRNMANARATQCHSFMFEINERMAKITNENSVLHIPLVSVSLPMPATEIWLKANELSPTEFTKWYKHNVGYER